VGELRIPRTQCDGRTLHEREKLSQRLVRASAGPIKQVRKGGGGFLVEMAKLAKFTHSQSPRGSYR
jgi:hypothetical protein